MLPIAARSVIQRLPSGMLRDAGAAAANALARADVRPLPDVQRASPAVLVVLGQNPGPYTLHGTNTYLVGTGGPRVLVDTGGATTAGAYTALLRRVLAAERAQVAHVLLTHWHTDHTGGLDAVLALLRETQDEPPSVHKHLHTEVGVPLPRCVADGAVALQPLADGDAFTVPGATLRVLHTPGHTTDSVSLHLTTTEHGGARETALFVGDCVLGTGSCVFTDLTAYLASLRRLEALDPPRLYCGHGPVVGALPPAAAVPTTAVGSVGGGGLMEPARPDTTVTGTGKLRSYIQHRLDREAQVLRVLQQQYQQAAAHSGGGSSPAGLTAADIANQLYASEGVAPGLLRSAAAVVTLHLHKLYAEGRVARLAADSDGHAVRHSDATRAAAAAGDRAVDATEAAETAAATTVAVDDALPPEADAAAAGARYVWLPPTQ
jgi:endoribonuclease LACTB2